jgi:hypothetical protein
MAGVGALMAVAWAWTRPPRALTPEALAARLAASQGGPAQGPVYHLGHSLVGRDMPAMLAQLTGWDHHSQLGWGASLMQHWQGDVPGFDAENAHPAHRPAGAAIDSGAYGAVVLTEMVELRDAIRYHDSAAHLARWALRAARGGAGQVYLYETWHRLDDPAGWEARVADDRALWSGLIATAMAQDGVPPVRIIPGGPALAAVIAAAEGGALPGLADRTAFFAPDDTIHLNDAGHYVIALTHHAVLTHRSPLGLAHALTRADGTAMDAIDPAAAARMQQIVWQVVTGDPMTGVPA